MPKSPSNASTDLYDDIGLGKLFAEPLNKIANMGSIDLDNLSVPLHYNFVIALLNDLHGNKVKVDVHAKVLLRGTYLTLKGNLMMH